MTAGVNSPHKSRDAYTADLYDSVDKDQETGNQLSTGNGKLIEMTKEFETAF